MVTKKSWDEFRETGLLMLLNQFLHIFGWAIVIETDEGIVKDVYPARVKFRGFSDGSQDKAYSAISKYMKINGEELYEETKEQK